jgi:hypothetical protein
MLIEVTGTINAAKDRQLLLDSEVIDQMNAPHGMQEWIFQND